MFAIFFSVGKYIGYKKLDYAGEEQTFELDYILVDELPEGLKNVPEGYYANVQVVDGEVIVTHEKIPEKPEPIDELTTLKLALAELAGAYEREKTELQLVVAELAEIVTGGAE